MKKLIFLLSLIVLVEFLVAQPEKQYKNNDEIQTVFSKNRSNGGYGALSIGFTEIDHRDAIVMGARGAWMIDHSFALGLGGYGFVNDINYDNPFQDNYDYNLAGGYGGLIVEPILAPRMPVHLLFPILFGMGGISYIQHQYNDWDYWWNSTDYSDVFWVIEPAVELEFNLTRYFRLAATGSYRLTSNINMLNTNPDILNGFTAGLIFKFGKF